MSYIDLLSSEVEALSPEEFISNFEQICSEFHNELKVLSFAVIIYDESIPEFTKLLRDDDYWRALDKSSGDKLFVFALRDTRPLSVYKMVRVPLRNSNGYKESYSALMESFFSKEESLVYPSVLFFQVREDEINDYILIPLKRNDKYKSFRSLQDLLKSIAEVLDKITPKYYGNQHEIFNLVRDELNRQQLIMGVSKCVKRFSVIFPILRIFRK